MLGPIRRYTAASGAADAWPSRSPFTFSVAQSGGGALISNGCHDVDLMLWLMGPIESFAFTSDSTGRMEGNCRLDCVMRSGAAASVEVSRTRTLSNTIVVEGEHGTAEAPLMGEMVKVFPAGAAPGLLAQVEPPALDYASVMGAQLADFAAAVRGLRPPLVDGKAGREMIALVEQCYARAQPMVLPWDLPVPVPEVA